MKHKTGHPAFDQGISVFMETFLNWQGIEIRVYDLERENYPIGIWHISWKGILRIFADCITKHVTIFAGMTMDDIAAYTETGDRPLGYDG